MTRHDQDPGSAQVAESVARRGEQRTPAHEARDDGRAMAVTDGGSEQLFVAELLRRESRLDETAGSAGPSRAYRMLAAAAGLVLLCGVVTASTAALSGPRLDRWTTAADPDYITGSDVLHPDLIQAALDSPTNAPAAGDPAPSTTGGHATTGQLGAGQAGADRSGTLGGAEQESPDGSPRDDTEEAKDRRTAGPGTPPPAGRSAPKEGLGVGTVLDPVNDPVFGIVTTFYRTAPTAPADAYDLLGPRLRAQGYQAFAASWAGVERATVDAIRQDGPNAALVSVSLERTDGTVLRTVQRMVVGIGPRPLIEDATLLSASLG